MRRKIEETAVTRPNRPIPVLSAMAIAIGFLPLGLLAPAAARAEAPHAIAQHKTQEGVVASVAGTTIKLESGADVKTDAKTKITRDGKPAKVSELQKGDRVKYALLDSGVAMYVHAEHAK